MASFEELFLRTQGAPIEYHGKTLVMFDAFPMDGALSVTITFESSNGAWRQGVALNCDGTFRLGSKTFSGKGGLVLWSDTSPTLVKLDVDRQVSAIRVKNVWDIGDGTMHSWHNGGAMIVEEVTDGRRYLCNDGEQDDDFDDLVVRIDRVR